MNAVAASLTGHPPPPTQFIPDTLPEAGTVALQEIIPAGCVETVHACIIIEATC